MKFRVHTWNMCKHMLLTCERALIISNSWNIYAWQSDIAIKLKSKLQDKLILIRMKYINLHTDVHFWYMPVCLVCVPDLNASTWSSRICFILRYTHWSGIFNLSNASWDPLPLLDSIIFPFPLPLPVPKSMSASVPKYSLCTLHKLEPHTTDLNWYNLV